MSVEPKILQNSDNQLTSEMVPNYNFITFTVLPANEVPARHWLQYVSILISFQASSGTPLQPTWFRYHISPWKYWHATETKMVPLLQLSKEELVRHWTEVLHATDTIMMPLLMSVTEAEFSAVVTSALCSTTTWFCDAVTTSKLKCNWGGLLQVITIHHLASVFVWRYFYYRYFERSRKDPRNLERSERLSSVHCSRQSALEFCLHTVRALKCKALINITSIS
jgi:hypothetical protein